jgi:ubiquinone/menaquinone biosynthesis C-methylase UbiE
VAEHVCPVWAGYFLANRLRKLLQNPRRILAPYVRAGMTVLDVGSAMGFFSLPMAEMVGPDGKVVCVDVQPGMLTALRRRAAKAGLADRIETHESTKDAIGLHGRDGSFDFALAFTVLHEVGDLAGFLREIYQLLKPGASFLLTEPILHVSRADFDHTLSLARAQGFVVTGRPPIHLSHTAVLEKPRTEGE